MDSRSRELLNLRYVNDLSCSEIAAHKSATTNAVRVALHRLRTALHRCIEERLIAQAGDGMNDPLESVSGYLDHDLSDAEVAELEAWILADPKHAAIFARRAAVHSQIRDALAGEVSLRLSQLRSPELFEPIEGANDFDDAGRRAWLDERRDDHAGAGRIRRRG